ncbi:MAG: OmpA family protein [Candidatus Eisenbacteria bacterium]|nr:OmpA family protein [Candidatus Latescibacterota bacterium]MBD3302492.1 OmpA family protein [Candidatus Eisenbacteria bacterium]
MRGSFVVLLLAVSILSCGGTRIQIEPLLDQIASFERETGIVEEGSEAEALLQAARRKRDQALDLRSAGKEKEAEPLLYEAIADMRAAWALANAAGAEEEASRCRELVERSRREWENAILALEHLERQAETSLSEVERTYPIETDTKEPPLPAPIGEVPAGEEETAPARLRDAWGRWLQAARDRTISTADLGSRFAELLALGTAEDGDRIRRDASLHAAHRTVQELQARVRSGVARQRCARAVDQADRLRAATEAIRVATIDAQAKQAEALKAEARSRQDEMFEALRKLEGKYAQIRQEARGTIVSLADILFDFDKVTLKRDVEFNLVKIATILSQFPEMDIQIEGHTDNIGTENYNQKLSERRAQTVHDFLSRQGIDPARMSVVGYGMSRPVAPNATEEGRQKNRRVDLVIQDAS